MTPYLRQSSYFKHVVLIFTPAYISFNVLFHCFSPFSRQKKHFEINKKIINDEYLPELVVLVTPNISTKVRSILKPLFCTRIIEVPPIPIPQFDNKKEGSGKLNESHVKSWNDCGYTKLNIFNLEVYSTILYIDSDCLVVKNVSHLLQFGEKEENEGSLIAAAPDIFPPDKFNAGVMIINPSSNVFADMMEKTKTLVSYDGGDTGFLNAYFNGWYSNRNQALHFGYNAQHFMHKCTYQKQPQYWELGIGKEKLHIIHYSSTPKPWKAITMEKINSAADCLNTSDSEQIKKSGNKSEELGKLWKDWYTRSQNYITKREKMKLEKYKRDRNAQAKRKTATEDKSSSRTNQRKGTEDKHNLLKKRYKELRKSGVSTKDSMLKARAEFGLDKQDETSGDAGQKVAQMFGMQM